MNESPLHIVENTVDSESLPKDAIIKKKGSGSGGGNMDNEFATKQELKDLKVDMNHRFDLTNANIEKSFAQFESKMIKWFVGTVIAIVGLLIAYLQLLH